MVSYRRPKIAGGFTLLELLLTLSIVAGCAVMAISDFTVVYHHIRTEMIAHQLMHELFLTRSQAVCRRQAISYCADAVDKNWDKKRTVKNASGQVLHVFGELPKHYHLIWRNSLLQNDKITFLPLGFTQSQMGSFYLFTPEKTLRIVVIKSGRVRCEVLNRSRS